MKFVWVNVECLRASRKYLYSLNVNIFHSLFFKYMQYADSLYDVKTNKIVTQRGPIKDSHMIISSHVCRSMPTAFISGISGSSRRFVQYSRCIIYREQTSEGPSRLRNFRVGVPHMVRILSMYTLLSLCQNRRPFLV